MAIVSCHEAKARDAPRNVELVLEFESRLRGAALPDGHTALELGNPFMPRAKVRGAPRTVEFSLYCEFGICVLRLDFRFLVSRYERNFSPLFCEILMGKRYFGKVRFSSPSRRRELLRVEVSQGSTSPLKSFAY